MIHLTNVPFCSKKHSFDCWYAALRMMIKFRDGANREPLSDPSELPSVLNESVKTAAMHGIEAQGGSDVELNQYRWQRDSKWRPVGLPRNRLAFATARNGLEPLQGGPWSAGEIERQIRNRGPLLCALDYGHFVVIIGADPANQDLWIHDPEFDTTGRDMQQSAAVRCPQITKLYAFPPDPN